MCNDRERIIILNYDRNNEKNTLNNDHVLKILICKADNLK